MNSISCCCDIKKLFYVKHLKMETKSNNLTISLIQYPQVDIVAKGVWIIALYTLSIEQIYPGRG